MRAAPIIIFAAASLYLLAQIIATAAYVAANSGM